MAEYYTPVVRFSRDPSLARIDSLKGQQPPTGATDSPERDRINETVQDFGTFYVVCIALSIITYVLDLVLVCILLYYYSLHGYGVYFALTLTFLLVPALFMTAVSMRWYIIDDEDPSLGRTSLAQWAVRIVFLLLQLSPLLRYIDTLIFGIKSKIASSTDNDTRQTLLYRRMLDEDTNSALLRLIHCFLHAAPQAVIQLMVLLVHIEHPEKKLLSTDVEIIQVWTVVTSLMSIAWSLTSYHRSVRSSRDDKDKLNWVSTTVAFCWHLMSALARILALSLLASIFPEWMGCLCLVHWFIMSIWLALGQYQSAVCSNKCEDLFLSMALGLAYVLAIISPRDGPTRYIYLVYYFICFMENTGSIVVWCLVSEPEDNPYLYYGAAGTQVVAFMLAITFLLLYYNHCHPSKPLQSKIPDLSDVMLDIERPTYSKSYNLRTSCS